MERSNNINAVADEVTDNIISKMNLIISNYADTDMVRRDVAKRKAKIKETLLNASKKIDEINSNNDLSNEEIINKMKNVQDSTLRKVNKLNHDLDLYLDKQNNVKWNKLQQMRFLYLELGKLLEKNTDFFLKDKLDELSLTDEERDAVYNHDLLLIRDDEKRGKVYQVICKSAAEFLQVGLNKLGIINSKVHTILQEEDIHHWFVVAQDDSKKQYFLTLAADIPFIMNNFPTEHFGTDFPLFDDNGNQTYSPYDLDDIRIEISSICEDCRLIGEKKKGFGIKHEVIQDDELRKIDTSICYESLYESLSFANSKVFSDLIAQTYEENSTIVRLFRNCFGFTEGEFDPILNNKNPNKLDNKNLFKPMSELKKDNYIKFKDYLNSYVLGYLNVRHGYLLNSDSNSYTYLRDSLINILELVREENLNKKDKKTVTDEIIINDDMSFSDILNKNKKLVSSIRFSSYFDSFNVINSSFMIQKNFDLYFDLLDKLDEVDRLSSMAVYDEQHSKLDKARDEITKKLENVCEQLSIRRMNHYLHEISYATEVKDDVVFPKDKFVPMEKVVKRFKMVFPKIMDMNSEFNTTVSNTKFSSQNYSEQIVIIKRILTMMYPDLTHENSSLCNDYKDKNSKTNLYSAVDNRINTYPLKDKETGEYCVGFTFAPAENEGIVEFIYVPSKNELRRRNPITDMKKYWIASVRFNEKLQNKVELESNNKKEIEKMIIVNVDSDLENKINQARNNDNVVIGK